MKRSLKIIIGALLFAAIWFIGISEQTISSKNKILIPFVGLVILGLISFGSILWKVSKLQEHPHERTLL